MARKKNALTAEQKMQRALIRVLREEPFYATILLKMEIVASDQTPTIATNGVVLRYNENFVLGLRDGELVIVMKHEAEHVALGHHIRLARQMKLVDLGPVKGYTSGDPRVFARSNIAADLAINSVYFKHRDFPKDGTYPTGKGYEDFEVGLNAEQYYKLISDREDAEKDKEQDESQQDDATDGSDGDEATGQGSDERSGPDEEDDGSTDGSGDEQSESGDSGEADSDDEGSSDESSSGDGGESSESDDGSSDGDGTADRGRGTDSDDDSDSDGPDSHGTGSGDAGEDQGQDGSVSESGRGSDLDETRDNPLGCFEPAPVDDDHSIEEIEADWQRTVSVAMAEAKEAGRMPAHLEELIEGAFGVSQVPWEQALRPYLQEVGREGFSYNRPRRRGSMSGVIMPDNHTKTLGKVYFVVDTSGSMSPDEMKLVFPELERTIASFPDCEITVVMHDTRVIEEAVETFTIRNIPIKIENVATFFKGRGGTRFMPTVEYLEKQETPALVVWLTDGEASDYPTRTSFPLVWLMTTDRVAPWGDTIRMETH